MSARATETVEVASDRMRPLVAAVRSLSDVGRQRGLGPIEVDEQPGVSGGSRLVSLSTPLPAIGDFELVAKISHMKGGRVFVQKLGRAPVDFAAVRAAHAEGRCDHCGVKRRRNVTFLVRNGEREVQVGSTCLARYVGNANPARALLQADLFSQACDLARAAAPDPPSGSAHPGRWPTVDEFLAHVAAIVAHEGHFVRKVDADIDRTATADLALGNFRCQLQGARGVPVSAADRERARAAKVEFSERAGVMRNLSGYDSRLLRVLGKDVAWPENQGILATVFERVSALRMLQVPRFDGRGSWLGEQGERVELVAGLRKVGMPVASRFGRQYPHYFVTETGDWVTWFATNRQLEPDRSYRLVGKVKRLEERRGHRVTVLTGCRAKREK